jgi:alpha-L-arabinofuranosidase
VSRAANGKQIFIKAVNTDGKHALRATVQISGAGVRPEAEMETITGDSLTAANSFASPEVVSTRRGTIRADSRFVVELPPYSVSVITLATTE